MNNSKTEDSAAKLIFADNEFCSQLINNYLDISGLEKIAPENIEDVTSVFVHMFTEERDADIVKRIRLDDDTELFFLLIEHKSDVAYNVVMQILRYIVFIWEEYEKEQESATPGISKSAGFRYPPVLPVVYYTGTDNWTASEQLSDRVLLGSIFHPYIPDFRYILVPVKDYSTDQLMEKGDGLSLVMIINKLQGLMEIEDLGILDGYWERIKAASTNTQMSIISAVVSALLRKYNTPEDEIRDFTDHIQEASMSDIFAHINPEKEYADMRKKIEDQAKQIDSQAREIDSQAREIDSQAREIDSQAREIDSQAREITELRAQLAAKRRFPFNLFKRSR